MKIVFLEPLGIPKEKLKAMAKEKIGDQANCLL